MCEGASKQSPDLKNNTAPGQRPPVFKFLDPPLISACAVCLFYINNNVLTIINICLITLVNEYTIQTAKFINPAFNFRKKTLHK